MSSWAVVRRGSEGHRDGREGSREESSREPLGHPESPWGLEPPARLEPPPTLRHTPCTLANSR